MPMIGASVVVLLLITYIPGISTFLPKALAGENGAYSGTVTASSDSADDAQDSTGGSEILIMISQITVILAGKNRPGTSPVPPQKPVLGQKVEENSEN